MKPEVALVVKALRDGKSASEAGQAYCWAKMVVPVELPRESEVGSLSPEKWPRTDFMAAHDAKDCLDGGGSDDEIAAAFDAGLEADHKAGVRWREMQRGEKPTDGALLRSLSPEGKSQAMAFFGISRIAKALAHG